MTIRNRSRSISVPISGTYRVTADDWTYPEYSLGRTFSFTDSMTDFVTPNFRARVAAGEIINNQLTQTKYNLYLNNHLTSGEIQLRGQYLYGSYAGFGATVRYQGSMAFGLPSWPYGMGDWIDQKLPGIWLSDVRTSELARLRDLAINAAYEDVNLKKADALVTAGEGRETIKYLFGVMKKVSKLVNLYQISSLRGESLPAKKWYAGKKPTSAQLADDYMAFRYALRPLYYEALTYMEALTSDMIEKDWNSTAVRVEKYLGTSWDEVSSGGPENMIVLNARYTPLVKLSARAGVWYGTCFDGLTEFDLILEKYGMLDLTGAAWELTTASFILDWFADIGKFLNSLTTKRGVNIKAAFVTLRSVGQIIVEGNAKLGVIPGYNFPYYASTPEVPVSALFQVQKVFREPVVGPPLAISSNVRLDLLKLLDIGLVLRSKSHRLANLSLID